MNDKKKQKHFLTSTKRVSAVRVFTPKSTMTVLLHGALSVSVCSYSPTVWQRRVYETQFEIVCQIRDCLDGIVLSQLKLVRIHIIQLILQLIWLTFTSAICGKVLSSKLPPTPALLR